MLEHERVHAGILISTSLCCVHREIEYKELQMSQEQSRATKPSLSYKAGMASSQDSRKQLKTKAVKIKTKIKMMPYPQVLGITQFYTVTYIHSRIESHPFTLNQFKP